MSDLLAPTDWDRQAHRASTNVLRAVVRPLTRWLGLLDRAPAYRTLVVAETDAGRGAGPC